MKGPYLKKWSQSDDPSLYVHDGLYHIAVSLILTKASTGRPKFFLILLGNTSRIPNLLSERPACQNRPCQVLCTPKRTHLWACRLHCGWTPDRQALIFFGDERYILYLPKTGLRTACLAGFLTWWPMQWVGSPTNSPNEAWDMWQCMYLSENGHVWFSNVQEGPWEISCPSGQMLARARRASAWDRGRISVVGNTCLPELELHKVPFWEKEEIPKKT